MHFNASDTYKVITTDVFGTEFTEELTREDLWDLVSNIQDFPVSWFYLLRELNESGEYKFSTNTFSSSVKIIRVNKETTSNYYETNNSYCSHPNKYINNAGLNTIKFWYCPLCKKDLGNA